MCYFNKKMLDKLSPEEKDNLLKSINKDIKFLTDLFNLDYEKIRFKDLNELEDFAYFSSDDLNDKNENNNDMDNNENKEDSTILNPMEFLKEIFSDLIYTGSEFKKSDKKENETEKEEKKDESCKITINEDKAETEEKKEYIKPSVKVKKKTDKFGNNISSISDKVKNCYKNLDINELNKKLNSDIYKFKNNNTFKNKRKDIKKRLLKEAEALNEKEYVSKLKHDILKQVDDLLSDEKTHNYKIYTTNNKPSVELTLLSMPVYLKENYYILNDMITEIKEAYEAENVYINTVNTDDENIIDLKVYIVL